MLTLLYNANVILKDRIAAGYVVVADNKIHCVGFDAIADLPYDRKIDLEGKYLAPGFVELHTHGAGGADFMDLTLEAFETSCLTHLKYGTTTILPTTVAPTREVILQSIDLFREAKQSLAGKGPYLHGLHMEGPFLNKEQCGAINPVHIRPPKPEEYEEYLQYGKGAIARWTLAVEQEGATRFAERLRQKGILPSVGHSTAEYCQVKAAYEKGVTHVTHLYSAMSTIVRKGGFRHSGVLESAFCIPEMTVELIADGCHVPLELLEMVYRVKGPKYTMLTTDSMRCAGLEADGISQFDGKTVLIEDGVCKLADRSAFAGSIATADRLIRVMSKDVGIPLYDAVRMMTLTPAEIIGLADKKGSIEKGKDADLIVFDEGINVSGVMVEGKGLLGQFA